MHLRQPEMLPQAVRLYEFPQPVPVLDLASMVQYYSIDRAVVRARTTVLPVLYRYTCWSMWLGIPVGQCG